MAVESPTCKTCRKRYRCLEYTRWYPCREADEIFFVGVKYSGMKRKVQVGHTGIGVKSEDSLEALGNAVVKMLFECADGDEKIMKIYLTKFLEAVAGTGLELFKMLEGQS